MGLFAGTTVPAAPIGASFGGGTKTVVFAKDGIQRETGASSAIRPSSTSMSAATVVTAFDMDAIRKIASFGIGILFSTSREPNASRSTTRPPRAT